MGPGTFHQQARGQGFTGLPEAEAARRLAAHGPNELPMHRPRGLGAIVLEVLREPMFLLLVAAGTLYLAMGSPGDALMLLGFVGVVMGITIVQARRTERALDALRDLASPRAQVVRDGRPRRIPGREVVPGDLVVLEEGDRVPADARLLAAGHLAADESLLTGESVPVRKRPDPGAPAPEAPGGDDLPWLYSGTLVTAGQGLAEVVATGTATELGRIGRALQAVAPEPSPLQRETRRLVRTFALVGLSACVAVVLLHALTRGADAGAWKNGLLAGITLAMAVLPEEFPVVLTVFLALGAWRISRSRVLTRRMPAIEALGAATVLCVDKTGTLTENRMTLRHLEAGDRTWDRAASAPPRDGPLGDLLDTAAAASRGDPFDPMEQAIRAAAPADPPPPEDLLREYPLAEGFLAVVHVWRDGADRARVAAKGAPEAIADLCGLPEPARRALEARAAALAARGLRVLAVARGACPAADLPEDPRALRPACLGLLGLEDPVRSTVPAAVAECRRAGVRVVMVTGDHPATARSIAAQAGLEAPDRVVLGAELAALDAAALGDRIRGVQVFARVAPTQKLRLVKALQAQGEVVGMTGDGVNDAPALRAAHIGIAMGSRGTDVAREAADLVLLEDDFGSLVAAIRLGRRIYDNIRKAVAFTLAVHVPIAGLSLLPLFVPDWPLLLLPVHIVFLELVIDPSCSLVFEAEPGEPDLMTRPPRDPREPLFSRRTLGLALLQGGLACLACAGVYLGVLPGHGDGAARAATFTALVLSFLGIILTNRSWTQPLTRSLRTPNPALWWVLAGASATLAVVLHWPLAQRLFHFAPLHPGDLALAAAAGGLTMAGFEVQKALRHRRAAPGWGGGGS